MADRRSTSLTLDRDLLDEAKALGVNISRAAEAGVLAAVKAERARRWKVDNAEAVAAYNKWIEEHGIPLARYRKF
ncbi:MAG: post-segregation antitoxin CcdA [Rhodobacteraceae bacterium PARR1]|nr:MAG: post-segregation antitoxin CcdA [Rhodobacteraceae bacterium PARR1]